MQVKTQIELTKRPPSEVEDRVLTPAALAFVAALTAEFRPRIAALLEERKARLARLVAGERLDFLVETRSVRDAAWTVARAPADLVDRRVEITGPVDRKMIINALNSGANVFMADFEDANAPTWSNLIEGQANVLDAVTRSIAFDDARTGKRYALAERTATLVVRPRGLHLPEKHALVDGRPVPGSLFDFGLHFFHCAKPSIERGTGPYYYLPKLEGHREARLWNDVFVAAQAALGVPRGTVRATVLIETLPAAFEMDEILFELKEHASGLNCGRWDYIFSFIKKRAHEPAAVLPDRSRVTMEQHFLRSYTQLLVKTCHRRGAFAMGGMAAQIPIKGDEAENRAALEKVRADKLREVRDGHDGTWVAHPGLVSLAREVFDAHMSGPNQLDALREDVHVTAEDLLAVPAGPRTLEGLQHDVRVGVAYLEAWLSGNGCVPLYHLMEDAATAEISRSQVWQWVHHGAVLDDGQTVTAALVRSTLAVELGALVAARAGASSHFDEAANLFLRMCTGESFEEFLTLPAYDLLVAGGA
jgi:malate synthase